MTNIIFLLLFLGLNLYLSYASVLVIYILYCTCSCSGRESRIPAPPAGHHWKEVRHDNTVTWLVSWTENIQGSNKYIMLNANSKLKVGYLLHNGGWGGKHIQVGTKKHAVKMLQTLGSTKFRLLWQHSSQTGFGKN